MPYFVQNVDPKLKWYQEMGRTQGHVANMLLQALIAQQTGGAFAPKNIPNPGYGQTGSPGTTFSQPQQGQLSPPQIPSQAKAGFRTPTPASPFASQRMINTQQLGTLKDLQSLQTQKAQSALMNQRANQPPFDLQALLSSQGGGVAPDKLQQLEDDALAGDEDSIAAYRKLKALGIL